MKHIIGIDVGTQSVKCGLINLAGMAIERISSRDYPSGALQSADEIWEATCAALRELTDYAGGSNIEGIGLSGQMHGTVLFDSDDRVIGPIINWQDERANAHANRYGGRTTVERMTELIGPDIFPDLGIDVMASGFFGATLFHLMEFEPEVYANIAHAIFPTDFVRRRITDGGPYATDITNAFSAGVFNTRESVWHKECISRLGLPLNIFPEVGQPGDIAGVVGSRAAQITGLRAGTPVTIGGGDNQMSMIGSGVFAPDSPLLINIGTSGQICSVTPDYIKIPGVDTRSFIRGRFALVGAGITGGICYTWLRNLILDDIHSIGGNFEKKKLFTILDELADTVPLGCDGLVFEPYMRGTRREPEKRAAFTGIGHDNFTLGHRARAVMEGVVGELLGFYNQFEGTKATRLTGAGNGLVKSEIWRRIAAQMFGMPLQVMDFENAVYGAALVSAEGLNLARIEDGRFDFVVTHGPSD
ncbi:MAG: FGGY family carbohydrate kinase [bacterium]